MTSPRKSWTDDSDFQRFHPNKSAVHFRHGYLLTPMDFKRLNVFAFMPTCICDYDFVFPI